MAGSRRTAGGSRRWRAAAREVRIWRARLVKAGGAEGSRQARRTCMLCVSEVVGHFGGWAWAHLDSAHCAMLTLSIRETSFKNLSIRESSFKFQKKSWSPLTCGSKRERSLRTFTQRLPVQRRHAKQGAVFRDPWQPQPAAPIASLTPHRRAPLSRYPLPPQATQRTGGTASALAPIAVTPI